MGIYGAMENKTMNINNANMQTTPRATAMKEKVEYNFQLVNRGGLVFSNHVLIKSTK